MLKILNKMCPIIGIIKYHKVCLNNTSLMEALSWSRLRYLPPCTCFWRPRERFTPYSFKLQAEFSSLQFWHRSTADLRWLSKGRYPAPRTVSFPVCFPPWSIFNASNDTLSIQPILLTLPFQVKDSMCWTHGKLGTSLFQEQLTGNFHSFHYAPEHTDRS